METKHTDSTATAQAPIDETPSDEPLCHSADLQEALSIIYSERARVERHMTKWDSALTLRLDQLLDIEQRISDYLSAGRRQS